MKRVITFGCVALSAMALAFAGRVAGVEGRGLAGNDNRHGEFAVDVRKMTNGTEVRLDGRFDWGEISQEPAQRFHIGMPRPAHVMVNDDHTVCEFDGPARLVRPSPNGPITVEGHLQVRFVDRHQPNGGSSQPLDILQWHFVAPSNDVDLAFEGLVGRGDANVFARVRN